MTTSVDLLMGTLLDIGPGVGGTGSGGGGGGFVTDDMTFTGGLITDAVRALGQAADFTDFLPVPGGVGIWPAYTNKAIQSVPGAAADTNVTVGGDVLAVLSKVVDPLAPVANASGEVWEFDNSAGSTDATADFAGATAATTAHSISISAKALAGTPTLMLGTAGVGSTPVDITATEWPGEAGVDNRTKSENITPAATDLIRVTVPAGAVVRFVAPQLQTGVIVTPWRRTDGSSQSTTAGRVQQDVAGLFTATQGWVVIRLRMGFASTAATNREHYAFSCRTDNNNRIGWSYSTGSNDRWQLSRLAAGAGTGINDPDTFVAGQGKTGVLAWTATQLRWSEGGAAFTNVANTSTPTLPASLDIGNFAGAGSGEIDSSVLWYATGSGTLTDADAAALNAFGNTPPTWAQIKGALPATAALTSLWPAVDEQFQKVGA